jgi:hypothetical protein
MEGVRENCMRRYINSTLRQIGIMKPNRVRWAGYVESMGETMNKYRFFYGKARKNENTKKA